MLQASNYNISEILLLYFFRTPKRYLFLSWILIMSKYKLPLIGGACVLTIGVGFELVRRRASITKLNNEVYSHLEVGKFT